MRVGGGGGGRGVGKPVPRLGTKTIQFNSLITLRKEGGRYTMEQKFGCLHDLYKTLVYGFPVVYIFVHYCLLRMGTMA